MEEKVPDLLVISGHIGPEVYPTLKDHLMPPVMKVGLIGLLIAYGGFLGWELVQNPNWLHVLVLVLYVVLAFFGYHHSKLGTVKRIIAGRKEMKNGAGYDMQITLRKTGVRIVNTTTGREWNRPWADFVSFFESDVCIAVFVRKNNYMLIPKNNMSEQQREQVFAMLHTYCPGLKKRL